MAVKVSVVIATYCTGEPLDDVVAALDAQTLPTDEYEVIFVDDGSPDDTFDRLTEVAAAHDNVRVDRIENSGWPGRPRNVGVGLATGEYVFFLDHDDYIFPEALERMYAFAREHALDMVIPKEVVKGWGTPSWASWRDQIDHLTDFAQHIIQCITPHKLYRRQFLIEQQITFPEGRIRLEDFAYNGLVYARTDAIGVLADYPCSTWIIHPTNSHKAPYDFDVYWDSFEKSVLPIVRELPPGRKRSQLLVRWYRSRILERLRANVATWSPEAGDRLFRRFGELLTYFPPEIDAYLNPVDRARSALLRSGDRTSLVTLSEIDSGVRLRQSTKEFWWRDGALHLRVTGVIVDSQGDPVPFQGGDRVYRRVPPELVDVLSLADRDFTDDIRSSFVEMIIRSRATSVDWIVPGTSSVFVSGSAEESQLDFEVYATIDPRTAAFGVELDRGIWDVFLRLEGLGLTSTTHVQAGDLQNLPALVAGQQVVAYPTVTGKLAVDVGSRLHRVAASARPTPTDISYQPGSRLLTVELPRVHVAGDTTVTVTVTVGPDTLAGQLVGDARGARITAAGELEMLPWQKVSTHYLKHHDQLTFIDPETSRVAQRIRPEHE